MASPNSPPVQNTPLTENPMPEFPSITAALPNPVIGNQAPTMENLITMFLQGQQAQQVLLEHLTATPASTPTITTSHKTDYKKPPLYNVPKLKGGVSEAVLQDWTTAVQTGDTTQQYYAYSN